MLPASLPLPHPPDRPAPYNPRSLPGSEQGGDWPFSLANMICMAMTSNYLLRAECQRRICMSDHPVRSAGGSGKTTGQKRDRLFELPLPPRPFYSIPPSVPRLLHECNKGRADSIVGGSKGSASKESANFVRKRSSQKCFWAPSSSSLRLGIHCAAAAAYACELTKPLPSAC